jgi:hypothetical protein
MQKVEGSNPFSRFKESPAPAGLSATRLVEQLAEEASVAGRPSLGR